MEHTIFTSVNLDYIQRAITLFESVTIFSPKVKKILFLVEPNRIVEKSELQKIINKSGCQSYDEILTLEDFPSELRASLEGLSVVEACTAVKGAAMVNILSRPESNVVTYLDPDLYFLGDLNQIVSEHQDYDILLTPHLLFPPVSEIDILNDEIGGMAKHGIFNLGFLSCKKSPESLRLATWWADRLSRYCKSDYAAGLFTDQKWFDMVPNYFNSVKIVRHLGWNLAPWNFKERLPFIENKKEVFFVHFSKFPADIFDRKNRAIESNALYRQLVQEYRFEFRKNDSALIPLVKYKESLKKSANQLIQNSSRSLLMTEIIYALKKVSLKFSHFVASKPQMVQFVMENPFLKNALLPIKNRILSEGGTESDLPIFESASNRILDILVLTHFGGGGVDSVVINDVFTLEKQGLEVGLIRPMAGGGFSLQIRQGKFRFATLKNVKELISNAPIIRVHHLLGLELLRDSLLGHDNLEIIIHDRYFLDQVPFRDAVQYFEGDLNIPGVTSPLNSTMIFEDIEWTMKNGQILNQAERVFAPSEYIRARYLEKFPNLEIEIIDFSKFMPEINLKFLNQKSFQDRTFRKNVLLISPTGVHKGSHVVHEVASILLKIDHTVRFIILGDLPLTDRLRFEKLENVLLLGQLNRNQLIYTLLRYNEGIAWIPSLTAESFSLALSDFFSTGYYVVASGVGALKERVTPGFGEIYEVTMNPHEIVDLLLKKMGG